MRISGSLYVSFDTVKSDFLSAKARLPESPVLTNTFTKLPRLGGIFQPLYTFFSLQLYRGIMFCLLPFNLFGKWGFDTEWRAIRLYMNVFSSKANGILAQHQVQMWREPWTGARSAWHSPSTAFWALALRTETGAWKTLVLRLREPVRRNRPRNLQWVAMNLWIRWRLDRTAASVHTVERFCTRPPVRPALLPVLIWHLIIISRVSSSTSRWIYLIFEEKKWSRVFLKNVSVNMFCIVFFCLQFSVFTVMQQRK